MNNEQETPASPIDDRWRLYISRALTLYHEHEYDDRVSEFAAGLIITLGEARAAGHPIEDTEAWQTADLRIANSALYYLTSLARQGWELAKSLPDRWYEADDPWEADELCLDVLQRRTDLWAAELILSDLLDVPESLSTEVDQFDEQMQREMPTLGTMVGATDYDRMCHEINFGVVEVVPWWLGAPFRQQAAEINKLGGVMSAPSTARVLPSETRCLPEVMSPSLAANRAETEDKPVRIRERRWEALEGLYFATLELPVVSNPKVEQLEQSLEFWRRSDQGVIPATDLVGQTVTLGSWVVGDIGSHALITVTLVELRPHIDRLLRVGESPHAWVLREEHKG